MIRWDPIHAGPTLRFCHGKGVLRAAVTRLRLTYLSLPWSFARTSFLTRNLLSSLPVLSFRWLDPHARRIMAMVSRAKQLAAGKFVAAGGAGETPGSSRHWQYFGTVVTW